MITERTLLKNRLWPLLPAILAAAVAWPAACGTLLFSNAVVHTVTGPAIEHGMVLVMDGTIKEVGPSIALAADEVIDLEGAHLYPGLINPASSLGLAEITLVRSTQDTTEVGEFGADVRSWLAVNPDSELLPTARANGTTHAVVVPLGSLLSGQSGLMQLHGWTIEQMAIKTPAALHLFWPAMTLDTTPKDQVKDKEKWKSLEEQARERRLKLKQLEDFFEEAEAYAKGTRSPEERVPTWEAMRSLVQGEIPLVVHADDIRQIRAVLDWAPGRRYQLVLAGGRDAWQVATNLAARNIPVIFDRVFNQSDTMSAAPARDTEPYDVFFRAPAVLAKAGVKVAIGEGLGSDAASNARNLPYNAAQAVAHGLSPEEALKAITLYPAEIYGVADRLGSIAPGREATLFTCTGDILDIRSQVKRMWIRGEPVSLETRQTRLYERYRSRPKP